MFLKKLLLAITCYWSIITVLAAPCVVYRVDISNPETILSNGFHGNNTPRFIKMFGDQTIFTAGNLDGIDTFKAEISSEYRKGRLTSNTNMFGESVKYYYERKMVHGYVQYKPKTLWLYKIDLSDGHHVIDLMEHFTIEENVMKYYKQDFNNKLVNDPRAANLTELEQQEAFTVNYEIFKKDVVNYLNNVSKTKEIQVKGPIPAEWITYIRPAEIPFLSG